MHSAIKLIPLGLILVMTVSLLSGCATVKPYEREYLADPIMQFDVNKEEAQLEMHFLLTREGSMGGYGGAGGGCACN